MRKIDLTSERVECNSEILFEYNYINFMWELWFDVDEYFGTYIHIETAEDWIGLLSDKLNSKEQNELIHDLNNLRLDEWVEILKSKGFSNELIEGFELFCKGYLDETWINFYTDYYPEKDDISAYYVLSTPDYDKEVKWELTSDEKQFLRKLMEKAIIKQIGAYKLKDSENILLDAYRMEN